MNPWNFLFIINIGFVAIIFFIHFNYTRKDFAANRIFSFFLFALGYTSLMILLLSTRWMTKLPHFARTGNLVLYLIYPSAYLYIAKILRQESWKKTDLLHCLPALLYLVDFFPYFIQDGETKRQKLIHDYTVDNVYIIRESWLFSHNFHFVFRMVLSLGYVAAMGKLWIETFYNNDNAEFRKENRSLMQWTLVLILMLCLAIVPFLVSYLFHIPLDLERMFIGLIYFTTVCFALFLFFKPEIIYGVKGLWVQPFSEPSPAPEISAALPVELVEERDGSNIYLKEETVQKLGEAIDQFLVNDKAFLKNGFSITDLSHAAGYPVHQISAFINNHLGMNFNEYVNRFRINYLLSQLEENKEWQNYTLEALAQKVGFNNRYTFINAFKKVTGSTPSAYLKSSDEKLKG
jgi:AraC-like DNA-binding protein